MYFIRQHPVLSGIITAGTLTIGSFIILANSRGYGPSVALFYLWLLVMGGACITLLITMIMMVFKRNDKTDAKDNRLLFASLWILLVGGGTCGLLITSMSLG